MKIPREVEVIKTKRPRKFEKIKVKENRIIRVIIERYL